MELAVGTTKDRWDLIVLYAVASGNSLASGRACVALALLRIKSVASSLSPAPALGVLVDKKSASRGTLRTGHVKRRADQEVPARGNTPQVQPLQNDHPTGQ